jgi:hypothetical protein
MKSTITQRYVYLCGEQHLRWLEIINRLNAKSPDNHFLCGIRLINMYIPLREWDRNSFLVETHFY